jgi:hypothetical protein
MTTRLSPVLAIANAFLACLALSACAAASSAKSPVPAPPPASTTTTVAASPVPVQLTASQLNSRLLTVRDLPPGYGPYRVVDDAAQSSNKPACLATLNSLSDFPSPVSPSAPVTEASTAFAASQAGPWVLEVVRSYPGNGAAQAFTAARTVLSGCHTFSMAWTSPSMSATETVTSTAVPTLGEAAWAGSFGVSGGVSVTGDLILAQAGSSLVALQVESPLGLPSAAQVTAMARTAVAKLAP